MKLRVQLITVSNDSQEQIHEVADFERDEELQPETVGLTLAEGQAILKRAQEIVVEQQVNGFLARHRDCPECGKPRSTKGHHEIPLRTVFGNVALKSPRLRHDACQPHAQKTFSPLAAVLTERTSPELLYLETMFASLIPYGATAKLLREVLPVDEKLNGVTIRNHLFAVAERTEEALGDEQFSFIEGCPRDWERLPTPDGPITVGIDGAYVRTRAKGWFEVIAGKSVLEFKRGDPEEAQSSKCFGFVQTYDAKPKRRLFELLKSQGLQENQQVVFL